MVQWGKRNLRVRKNQISVGHKGLILLEKKISLREVWLADMEGREAGCLTCGADHSPVYFCSHRTIEGELAASRKSS